MVLLVTTLRIHAPPWCVDTAQIKDLLHLVQATARPTQISFESSCSKQAQIFYEKIKIRKYKMGPRKQPESPMTLISQKFKKVKSYHELLYVGRRLFQKDPDVSNH